MTKEYPNFRGFLQRHGAIPVDPLIDSLMSKSWFPVTKIVPTRNLQMSSSLSSPSLSPTIMDIVQ